MILKELKVKKAYVQLEKELREAKDEMEWVYNYFSTVTDPALIDASIYQINAVRKKYDYLVIQARQLETGKVS